MNIVIFGCRKITVDILKHIKNNSDHKISLVVNHDEERDRVFDKMLVGEYCNSVGIDTVRFDSQIDTNLIKKHNPDIIFSTYYRKILNQEILSIPKMGCINVHPAILPKYRGPAPSLWNILNNDDYAGTTIHYMEEGVDSGDIIDQLIIPIDNRTGFELNRDLMNLGVDIFKKNFQSIINGTNKRVPQDNERATYCLPFKKSLRYLSWDDPDYIKRKVRVFAKPYDGAITFNSKCKILIWDVETLNKRDSFLPPGFYEVKNDQIIVQTCTLPILVKQWDVLEGTISTKGRFTSGVPT